MILMFIPFIKNASEVNIVLDQWLMALKILPGGERDGEIPRLAQSISEEKIASADDEILPSPPLIYDPQNFSFDSCSLLSPT